MKLRGGDWPLRNGCGVAVVFRLTPSIPSLKRIEEALGRIEGVAEELQAVIDLHNNRLEKLDTLSRAAGAHPRRPVDSGRKVGRWRSSDS